MSITLRMVNGDISILPSGSAETVMGIEKCAQDIAESLLNTYDPLEPDYYNGSEFWRLFEDPGHFDVIGIESTIETMAEEAIQRLMELQENDQFVDDDELIDYIEYIRVWKIGPMSWAFHAHVVTDSDERANVGFDIDLDQQLPPTIEPAGIGLPGGGVFL